jgi:hypothetical protein
MSRYKIELKWAIIFTLMMLLWMVMEKLAGLHDKHIDQHAIYTNFIAIPAIIVYVLTLLDKRKKFYGGFMTYGQGFISGLTITLIVTLFSPLTQYITSTIITPDYFTNTIEYVVHEGIMITAIVATFTRKESIKKVDYRIN